MFAHLDVLKAASDVIVAFLACMSHGFSPANIHAVTRQYHKRYAELYVIFYQYRIDRQSDRKEAFYSSISMDNSWARFVGVPLCIGSFYNLFEWNQAQPMLCIPAHSYSITNYSCMYTKQ